MLAIGALALISVVGFGLVLVATGVVAIGVRQEEHHWTLKHGRAPGRLARLTRVTLGHYVRKHDDEPVHVAPPDYVLPWYQRSPGPVRPVRRADPVRPAQR
jgi:hypothetical protein